MFINNKKKVIFYLLKIAIIHIDNFPLFINLYSLDHLFYFSFQLIFIRAITIFMNFYSISDLIKQF